MRRRSESSSTSPDTSAKKSSGTSKTDEEAKLNHGIQIRTARRSGFTWLTLFAVIVYSSWAVYQYQYENLPVPLTAEQAGKRGFSEVAAMKHVKALTELGPHTIGSDAIELALQVGSIKPLVFCLMIIGLLSQILITFYSLCIVIGFFAMATKIGKDFNVAPFFYCHFEKNLTTGWHYVIVGILCCALKMFLFCCFRGITLYFYDLIYPLFYKWSCKACFKSASVDWYILDYSACSCDPFLVQSCCRFNLICFQQQYVLAESENIKKTAHWEVDVEVDLFHVNVGATRLDSGMFVDRTIIYSDLDHIVLRIVPKYAPEARENAILVSSHIDTVFSTYVSSFSILLLHVGSNKFCFWPKCAIFRVWRVVYVASIWIQLVLLIIISSDGLYCDMYAANEPV